MYFGRKIDEELDELVRNDKKKKKRKQFFIILPFFLIVLISGCFYFLGEAHNLSLAIDKLPEITYDENLKIHGCNVKPGAKVKMVINDDVSQFTDVGPDGCFSLIIDLDEGLNKIEAFVVGQEETVIENTIEYIIKTPSLNIIEPKDGATVNSKEVLVKGITDVDVKITIQDKKIEVKADGTFETKAVILFAGSSEIKIVADNSKKTIEYVIKVKLINNKSTVINPQLPASSSGETDGMSDNSQNGDTSFNNEEGSQNGGTSEPVVIYPSKVIISYIAYTNDPNQAGYGEYIELKNTGGEDKDITGWSVLDGDGNLFVFPSYVLSSGATVRITTNTGRFVFNSSSPVWAKIGEPGYLKDASGRLVDIYSY